MLRLFAFLGCFAALSITGVAAQTVPLSSDLACKLSGAVTLTVSDLSGARIPNVFVLLRANRWSDRRIEQVPLEVRTSSAGIITASVPCGYADLFVAADGFTPQARELLIDQKTPSISVRLEVRPQTEQ
jgi:hypothetical protein